MINTVLEVVAGTLNFFYTLVPSYAVAIGLLTLVVMAITTPLTLKGTRSMIEMQRLQPEIRRMQAQYKDDRQKLNEEMMRFYKEHEINPLGGCLPLLIQLPVFSVLYWVIRGLTNRADFVGLTNALTGYGLTPAEPDRFEPKYLDHSTELFKSLSGNNEMVSFGVDLAITPQDALREGFVTALPYVLAIIVIGALAWYQQKQIMGRNAQAEINPQQRMMMRLGPIMQVFFTFISPAALGIYFLVSTAWRVIQQTYITHSMYKGEDSPGVQAQKAMAAMKADRKTSTPRDGNGTGGARRAKQTSGRSTAKADSTNGSSAAGNKRQPSKTTPVDAPAGATSAKPHPRSRKKKKRK